jgi:hypothetical protein
VSTRFFFPNDALKRSEQGQVVLDNPDLKVPDNINQNASVFEECKRLS